MCRGPLSASALLRKKCCPQIVEQSHLIGHKSEPDDVEAALQHPLTRRKSDKERLSRIVWDSRLRSSFRLSKGQTMFVEAALHHVIIGLIIRDRDKAFHQYTKLLTYFINYFSSDK